jgi:hypothetical protein
MDSNSHSGAQPISIQLKMAELYALDLEADTGEQIQSLQQLREELALTVAVGRGGISVARERFEAATHSTEVLLDRLRAQRELLNDLRASLRQLRSSLHASGTLRDRRLRPRDPAEASDEL